MDLNLFNFFGIDFTWTFFVLFLILIILVFIAVDIREIRDHHQYNFEQENKKKNIYKKGE